MPYTSDSWTFGHVPTTFKRLPTVNRWGVLHGFYSDQRDDQELSNSAPDMPSGVGFRILANRNIWRFPNNYGTGVGLATNNNGQFIYSGWSGALTPKNNAWSGYERQPDQTNRDFGTEFELNFSKGNAIYSDSVSTVQVSAIFGLNLIKAF